MRSPTCSSAARIEIDVATLEREDGNTSTNSGTASWTAPEPALTAVVDFTPLDVIEVQCCTIEGGPRLMAAIELVSPANKNRPGHRRAVRGEMRQLPSLRGVGDHRRFRHRLGSKPARRDHALAAKPANGVVWESPTHLYAARPYRHPSPWRSIAKSRCGPAVCWRSAPPLPTLPLWARHRAYSDHSARTSTPVYQATCTDLRIRTGG